MIERRARQGGFTLLEVLIAVAIVGVLVAVSAPSMKRYIDMQRLRSTSSELLGDLQYARSEAIARRKLIAVKFESAPGTATCYTVAMHTAGDCLPGVEGASTCSCLSGAGSACAAGDWVEVKTVTVPSSRAVEVLPLGMSRVVAFDPTSGKQAFCSLNRVGTIPRDFTVRTIGVASGVELYTSVGTTGRPRNCLGAGTLTGVPLC